MKPGTATDARVIIPGVGRFTVTNREAPPPAGFEDASVRKDKSPGEAAGEGMRFAGVATSTAAKAPQLRVGDKGASAEGVRLLASDVAAQAQARTMMTLLRRARAEVEKGNVPVVQIDLDFCGLTARQRTKAALAKLGETLGIPELSGVMLSEVPVGGENTYRQLLPAYTKPAFEEFLDLTGLREKYPSVDWATAYDHAPEPPKGPDDDYLDWFWNFPAYATDEVTAGLVQFIRQLEELGAVCVFNTARWDNWSEATRVPLEAAGLGDVPLFMKKLAWQEQGISNEDGKRLLQSEIAEAVAARKGVDLSKVKTIAIVDDLKKNRASVASAVGDDCMEIAIAIPFFTSELSAEAMEKERFAIADFRIAAEKSLVTVEWARQLPRGNLYRVADHPDSHGRYDEPELRFTPEDVAKVARRMEQLGHRASYETQASLLSDAYNFDFHEFGWTSVGRRTP